MSNVNEPQKPRRPRRMACEPEDGAILHTPAPVTAKRLTKASIVEELLRADGGTTLDELCQATGWQAHTCRAFLTGLRKKGHGVVKAKREDGLTCWSTAAAEDA